jgi:Tfp pilus assembly protein PilE
MYAIPKYQGMVEEARTAQAKAQLGTVRSALAIYYAKNSGKFPATLDASLFAEGTVPYVEATDQNNNVIKSNSVKNVTHAPITVDDISDAGGWVYGVSSDLTQSDVRINAKGTGVDGTPWYQY